MARRLWRLLVSFGLPTLGLVLVIGGVFDAGALSQAESTWPGRVATMYWVRAPAAIVLGCLFLLLALHRWVHEPIPDDEEDDAEEQAPKNAAPGSTPASSEATPNRVGNLLRARDYLPDPMPEGWSRPVAVRGQYRWVFTAGTDTVALVLVRRGGLSSIKVFIVGQGARELVSDARCTEILEHMQHVGEFIEADGDPKYSETRVWIALPVGLRPQWRVPKSISSARERTLSPHLVAARKYLPQRLPAGWSVPIAIGDDHGTEWKDGAWMIGTSDDRFIIVFLVTSRGRVKLSVTFFGSDGIEVSEGSAAEMLRHFRGVLEFAQTEAVPGEVPTVTYLGEIAPEGGTRVLLN